MCPEQQQDELNPPHAAQTLWVVLVYDSSETNKLMRLRKIEVDESSAGWAVMEMWRDACLRNIMKEKRKPKRENIKIKVAGARG